MIEAITALIATYLLTWQGLAGLFILGILYEYNECSYWALLIGIITIIVCHFFFNIDLATLATYAIGYFVVGIVWSFWRYKSYVKIKAEHIRKNVSPEFNKRHIMAKQLEPAQCIDKITAWIIIWPFSLIEQLIGDIIRAVNGLATHVFKSVYYRIFTVHTADLLDDDYRD